MNVTITYREPRPPVKTQKYDPNFAVFLDDDILALFNHHGNAKEYVRLLESKFTNLKGRYSIAELVN